MSANLQTYKVAFQETSSDSKFDNLVQTLEDALNAVGDTSKMAWAAGQILSLAQLKQDGATSGQVLGWNGSAWAPAASTSAGGKLDYAKVIAAVTVSATTEGTAQSLVAGASIAYDNSDKRVEFWAPSMSMSVAGITLTLVLFRGATAVGQALVQGNTDGMPLQFVFYDEAPAAGTFKYEMKAFRTGGNCTVSADAGGPGKLMPMFLRVSKA